MRPLIPDVLAERYASTAMLHIWSPEAKIIMERRFWLLVLKIQRKLSPEFAKKVPWEALQAYEAVVETVDFESIRKRELELRHDVKARIEEFNELAGHYFIHEGMTSRDLTENVEQVQIYRSARLIEMKVIAALARLTRWAEEYGTLPIAGRSHNVAAQMTILGKRFASSAEELLLGYSRLHESLEEYPLRGIKGPMGTQQDMLDLLGDEKKVDALERLVGRRLGLPYGFHSVGQVYPRSLDLQIVSELVQIGAAASSFATTLRLMAGQELVTEGFKEGQVGSSAMPHKMNARSSERICGFYNTLCGYHRMIEGPAGNQWNEGDVSCSVVRRVALQGAFLTIDGMLETWLTVLDELGAYPAMIAREIDRYLPFLATTKILTAALKKGMRREDAHALIKKHAVAAALEMREQGIDENPLLSNLGNDPDFALNSAEIGAAISRPAEFTGNAERHVARVIEQIALVCSDKPDAVAYEPEEIL